MKIILGPEPKAWRCDRPQRVMRLLACSFFIVWLQTCTVEVAVADETNAKSPTIAGTPWHQTPFFYGVVASVVCVGVLMMAGRRNKMQAQQITELKQEVGRLTTVSRQLRETQDELVKSECLRALDEMAAGVAHDVNNSLVPVAIYSEMIRDEEPVVSDRIPEIARTIRKCVADATTIIKRLHPSYRSIPGEQEQTDVEEAIEKVVQLCRARCEREGDRSGVRIFSETTSVILEYNSSEVQEMLLSLIDGAIRTRSAGVVILRCFGRDNLVTIEIEDDGTDRLDGTAEAASDSTLATSALRGNGKGLATSRAIVNSCGGDVEIETTTGGGTLFRIMLPAYTPDTAQSQVFSASPALPRFRILLVDDNQQTRESLLALLESLGQEVYCAAGGEGALAAVASEPAFDVLLADYLMPGMTGYALCQTFSTRFPETSRIIMTGFVEPGLSEVCEEVLLKPISAKRMREALIGLTSKRPDGSVTNTVREG